jgi:hypothetical protein
MWWIGCRDLCTMSGFGMVGRGMNQKNAGWRRKLMAGGASRFHHGCVERVERLGTQGQSRWLRHGSSILGKPCAVLWIIG